LILSRFDPYVFSLCSDKICNILKTKAPAHILIQQYCEMIPKLRAQFYPLPTGTDHLFNFGLLLHTVEHYDEAIPYYVESLQTYGDRFATLYNLGICSYMNGDYLSAQTYFERALPLEASGDHKAQLWLEETEKQLKP
jgi:tetratricopeptide (TPR) repeat protein